MLFPSSYNVQEFTIPGTELQKARELDGFGMIVITLKPDNNRILVDEIFAADEKASPLGLNLQIENPGAPEFGPVDFDQPWTNASFKISSNMLKKVSNPSGKIKNMRFIARKYNHNEPGSPHDKKEYDGYKVIISN